MTKTEIQSPEIPSEAIPEPSHSIFTPTQKLLIGILVAITASSSAFASNIYFPAIPTISENLHVSPELINLTVTSYMILQGLSPSLWGAIADVHGRRVTYICTMTLYLGACIGLAETKHFYQLVILRCLQSTGSASTIALGAGVIGDITIREERGGYMGIYQTGNIVPLAVGPILGGVFAQTLGWRAIFWFLTIYAGFFLVALIIFLPETLRSLVGNGSIPAKGAARSLFSYIHLRRHPELIVPITRTPSIQTGAKKLTVDFLGPLKIVISRQVTLLIVIVSIHYTIWQMTVTAMSTLFAETYHLSELQIGLTYIANGCGSMLGTLSTGKLLDIEYRRFLSLQSSSISSANSEEPADPSTSYFPLEVARLRLLPLWITLQIASILVFGWTLHFHVHISLPIISTFFVGWSAMSIYISINTFLVDVFPRKSSSATAALNLARCLTGAGGTAAVLPLVGRIGVGWAFTCCVGMMIICLGCWGAQMRWGERWRRERELIVRE